MVTLQLFSDPDDVTRDLLAIDRQTRSGKSAAKTALSMTDASRGAAPGR
jgi:hypothetical protein